MSPKTDSIYFMLEGRKIEPERKIEYLGVTLDKVLTMTEEVKRACEKVKKTARALSVPNVTGMSANRRAVLCAATQSILLYGAVAWRSTMDKERCRGMIRKAERPMALRIASGYRTVSSEAIHVIAGMIRAQLLAEERWNIHQRRKTEAITPDIRKLAREVTLNR